MKKEKSMEKTLCVWCFNNIETEKPGSVEFPKQSGIFFCSVKCRNNATVEVKGKKEIDFIKVNKHAQQIRQKKNREMKSRLLASLLEKERLEKEDLALLHTFLTSKQRLALSVVGLSSFSWAVHNEPKTLMKKIDALVKELRG
jgi:hypothetical protein